MEKPSCCAALFFYVHRAFKSELLSLADIKKPASWPAFPCFGGERGIRTPGGLTLNGFQARRIRPLCHLSRLNYAAVAFGSAKVIGFSVFRKAFRRLIF